MSPRLRRRATQWPAVVDTAPVPARITFVLTGEGVVQRVLVAPDAARAGIEPVVRGMTLPLEGSRTPQYSYTIRP